MEYKITKEQVKAAYENKEELKRLFPDAFGLEVGKWYKFDENYSSEKYYLFNYQGYSSCTFNNNYGFNRVGEWRDKGLGVHENKVYRPATQDEIRTALLKEAERRGLTKGVKIKSPEPNFDGISKGTIEFQTHYDNGRLFSSGLWLFKDGLWAEVIKEIELTLEDIAEKFGVSVEEIKIKK